MMVNYSYIDLNILDSTHRAQTSTKAAEYPQFKVLPIYCFLILNLRIGENDHRNHDLYLI